MEFANTLRRFVLEATWLVQEFSAACPPARSPIPDYSDQLICEMTVIRLHDAWARFCRELVIMSACGRVNTLGGTRLSPAPGITSRRVVIPSLIATYRKRRFEPHWADATECIDAAQRLRVTNLPTIAGALGAIGSPADELRKVRNHYAHRSESSAADATSTGHFVHVCHPFVFELGAYVTGGVRRIEAWSLGLQSVAKAAIQ